MDRPCGISDFAFPNRWDRESGPDLVERAGQASRRDREQGPAERERGSNSSGSRGGFDAREQSIAVETGNTRCANPRFVHSPT